MPAVRVGMIVVYCTQETVVHFVACAVGVGRGCHSLLLSCCTYCKAVGCLMTRPARAGAGLYLLTVAGC